MRQQALLRHPLQGCGEERHGVAEAGKHGAPLSTAAGHGPARTGLLATAAAPRGLAERAGPQRHARSERAGTHGLSRAGCGVHRQAHAGAPGDLLTLTVLAGVNTSISREKQSHLATALNMWKNRKY